MSDTETTTVRQTGCVKWFNNSAGFGFITTVDGDNKGDDVFVHHTGLTVSSEQYKYLVTGEYVTFSLSKSDNTEHPFQADDVRGICNGKLMCETRHESRQSRGGAPVNTSRSEVTNNMGHHVRVRGQGPREGLREGEEWLLIKRKVSRPTERSNTRGISRT